MIKTSGKKPKRFEKVFDGKRQRVRGLWYRYPHGPFVAQITDRTPGGHTPRQTLSL